MIINKKFWLLGLCLVLTGCGFLIRDQDAQTIEQGIAASEKLAYYTPERLAAENKNGKPTVVFVSANWCPNCVLELRKIIDSQAEIPVGQTLLISDYDVDTEFNKAYKVRNKHSLVVFDSAGEYQETKGDADFADMLKFWGVSGGNT